MMNVTIATAVPLIVCSILAFALMLERGLFFLRMRRPSKRVKNRVIAALGEGDAGQAVSDLRDARPFFAIAINALHANRVSEKSLRDEAVTSAMRETAEKVRANFSGLLTIAALAPMFGLLGTVVGLMRSFRSIGLNRGPVEPALVADGLWLALSTTAVGLVIAAICIVIHAVFASQARRALVEATVLLNRISLVLASGRDWTSRV